MNYAFWASLAQLKVETKLGQTLKNSKRASFKGPN